MGTTLRVLILCLGLFFVVSVFRLLIKRKLNEKNSIAWLLGAVLTLVVSAFPGILDKLAARFGVDYPPTLMFLFSTLLLLLITLYNSVQISIMGQQIRELTQNLALHEKNDKNTGNDKTDEGNV